jgi:hypothetical protein
VSDVEEGEIHNLWMVTLRELADSPGICQLSEGNFESEFEGVVLGIWSHDYKHDIEMGDNGVDYEDRLDVDGKVSAPIVVEDGDLESLIE